MMKYIKKFNESLSYDDVEIDSIDDIKELVKQIEELTNHKVIEISGEYTNDIDLGIHLDNGDSISIDYAFAPYVGYKSITGKKMGITSIEYNIKNGDSLTKTDEQIKVEAGREIYQILKSILEELGIYEEGVTLEYKEPIDVESDIEDFREKFGPKANIVKSRLDKMSNEIGITLTDNWHYYLVSDSDDYGRATRDIMTVRAVNKEHAKLKVATIIGDSKVFTTRFYIAIKVNIDKMISDTENQIASLQKKLERLKNVK